MSLKTGPAREGDYGIRILTTLPRQSEVYRSQLNAIKRAKSHIWIQNAYFASSTILYELVKARLRGVDVRVVLPMSGATLSAVQRIRSGSASSALLIPQNPAVVGERRHVVAVTITGGGQVAMTPFASSGPILGDDIA